MDGNNNKLSSDEYEDVISATKVTIDLYQARLEYGLNFFGQK